MFKNKVIRYSTIAMIIAILAYFFIENFGGAGGDQSANELITNPEQYKSELKKDREAKDEQFKTAKDSPIADKERFHGLHYFEPDLSFRVKANISPYMNDDKEVFVKYTDGTDEKYEKYGYANFSIGGETQKLLLLKNESVISVLFKDATSGKETYGGGRYMDYALSEIKNNTIILDFNNAYNPYCVYQESYACPLPPAENKLTVAVRAGELIEGAVHE